MNKKLKYPNNFLFELFKDSKNILFEDIYLKKLTNDQLQGLEYCIDTCGDKQKYIINKHFKEEIPYSKLVDDDGNIIKPITARTNCSIAIRYIRDTYKAFYILYGKKGYDSKLNNPNFISDESLIIDLPLDRIYINSLKCKFNYVFQLVDFINTHDNEWYCNIRGIGEERAKYIINFLRKYNLDLE